MAPFPGCMLFGVTRPKDSGGVSGRGRKGGEEEVEGKIESVGIMTSSEIENLIKNPDNPNNPFAPYKVACYF